MSRLFILISFLFIFVAPALAQEPHWAGTLGTIRADVDRIIEENNTLQAEYNALKEKIFDIQSSINTYKLENQKLEQDINRVKKMAGQEQLTREAINQRVERLNQEAEASKGKMDELKKKLMNYEETLRLWTLQINDLQLEKEQLALELEAQERLKQQIESGEAEELKKIETEASAVQQQAQELEGSAEGFAAANQQSREELERLKQENRTLEEKIAGLERQKKEKIREAEEWRRKLEKEAPSAEYGQKLKEKRVLESEISKLESQLDSVRKSVEQSAQAQSKRRALLDQIMNLDKENRELRQKISELKASMGTAPAPTQ